MDRGTWCTIDHGVAKSQTQLPRVTEHATHRDRHTHKYGSIWFKKNLFYLFIFFAFLFFIYFFLEKNLYLLYKELTFSSFKMAY